MLITDSPVERNSAASVGAPVQVFITPASKTCPALHSFVATSIKLQLTCPGFAHEDGERVKQHLHLARDIHMKCGLILHLLWARNGKQGTNDWDVTAHSPHWIQPLSLGSHHLDVHLWLRQISFVLIMFSSIRDQLRVYGMASGEPVEVMASGILPRGPSQGGGVLGA